jgi:hypothetical protein
MLESVAPFWAVLLGELAVVVALVLAGLELEAVVERAVGRLFLSIEPLCSEKHFRPQTF